MSYKDETIVSPTGSESVKSDPIRIGSNSGSCKFGAAKCSPDSIIVNNEFRELSDEQADSTEALGNENCEGVGVQNGLSDELHSSDTAEVEGGSKDSQVFVSQSEDEHKDVAAQNVGSSSAPWECTPGHSNTAGFACRRDSSSDSVDSESSSSSSSSPSDWDSSSDTALGSDESRKGRQQVAACAQPKRVVLPCVKTKGEFTLDDLPPIEDLHISLPERECKELGKVVSIIDKLVVVEPHRDMPTLNLDSVLFLDCGKRAMGHVFDVFGQVKEPLYCVRFNSADHIRDSGVSVGTKVYCAPDTPYTNYVFLNQLLRLRGSDASWEQDNEPPATVVFYSDDEEEREARRKQQHEKSKLHTAEGADGFPATQEPKPKRINLMEERNNRRNLLLNATYRGSSQNFKRLARGRGWMAPSPDDYIIKPSSLSFSTDWQTPQDGQPESKPRFPSSTVSPAASSPLFGICRPPRFPFTPARFSVPPPITAGKSLFGVLRNQAPEMLAFVQPPPSTQPPVRTFVGSGAVPFSTTQHPPARPSKARTVQPRPFGSPVPHISFRPMQCPPNVLTSPPPPFGVSFNMMQCQSDLPAGRMQPATVGMPFRSPSQISSVASQQREFPDAAASKSVPFDPSQPPPKLPFSISTSCGTVSGSSYSQVFSTMSGVLLSPAPNPSTTLAPGIPHLQPNRATLPFNPAQRPPCPQQPSPPVFGTPWLRDSWQNPAASQRPTGAWQASSPTSRLPSDIWQPRDVWRPQTPVTPPCTSWQVPSSWRLPPAAPQQPAGVLPGPAWQSCDQPLGPSRPAMMQFDTLTLRSPPPPSSSESLYR